jgi:formate hydrogenlyase subunit 3/multisubunit Na+/H+ antiporter MnhD subunit
MKTLLNGRNNRLSAFLIASSAALLVYTSFFQRNFFSKRYLVFTILIFAAAFFGAAALNHLVIERFFSRSQRSERRLCLWSALILALLLLMNFKPVPLYFLEKKQTITVQPAVEQGNETAPVELVSVRNPLGYIPFEQLGLAGERDNRTGT